MIPAMNMKLRLWPVILFILCAPSFSLSQSSSAPKSPIVLRAARLLEISTGKIITPGEVLVDGERIVEVGASCEAPS